MAKDYYGILGVSKTASKEDIKKAFYRLAHKYHPDKKGGDENKFKEVNEAYQILSDESKRREYDTYGEAFGGQSRGGFSGFQGFEGMDFGDMDFGNLGDIFSDFFSQGSPFGKDVRRGRDMSLEMQISFKESVFGTERKVLINKISKCSVCLGSGAKEGTTLVTCKRCNGKGKIHETRRSFVGTFSTTRICDECSGSGKTPEHLCGTCKGAGVTKKAEEIRVKIPPGIENGEMIRMPEMGEAVKKGTSGDLYVKIYVTAHPFLKREGINLVTKKSVKLSDAILGTTYPIETLEGESLFTIPAGTSSGDTVRLKNHGILDGNRGKRGDLIVELSVKTPENLSKRARNLVEDLKKEGL